MLARGEREINQLLLEFVCCRFAFGFSGPPLFTAELFTFHSGLGPKTHVENTNAYLGQDDSEKLPEK